MILLGNDFGRTSHPPIVIHNVDGLKIQDNSIEYPAAAPGPLGLTHSSGVNWLYVQDCAKVVLRENRQPAR